MSKRNFFRKTQQKHYTSRSYRNPYFQTNTASRVVRRWMVGLGCVVVAFLTGVVFLFGHPMFRIVSVKIDGIQQLDRERLSQTIRGYLGERVLFFLNRQNRFLFDAQTLQSRLNNEFTFRDLQIDQKKTHISIRAVERTSQLLWKSNQRLSVVDLEGVVIREVGPDEQDYLIKLLPLFVDRNEVNVRVGESVLTRVETDAIFRFQEHLRAQGIEFLQTEFDRLSGKWVGVLTTVGYYILFDPLADVDVQATRLNALFREKISDQSDQKKLQYIDLRFGDHVYFK